MVKRHEASFRGTYDSEIFYQTWTLAKKDDVKGTVIVTHGLAEHSDCYHSLAEHLAEKGWNTLAWDLRGHGQSSGKRGYVAEIEDFSKDLKILSEIASEHHKGPRVLFGHSLGGQICLRALLDYGDMTYSALALSSPALGLSVKVPAFKEKLAHIAADWLPRLTMHNELDYRDLTRDEDHLATYANDPLRQDKISPALYLGMLKNFSLIKERAREIHLPTLMQLAGVERIVSTKTSEEVFEGLGSEVKVLRIYPESHHEIYNDLDKDSAREDLVEFLERVRKLASGPANKKKINLNAARK